MEHPCEERLLFQDAIYAYEGDSDLLSVCPCEVKMFIARCSLYEGEPDLLRV